MMIKFHCCCLCIVLVSSLSGGHITVYVCKLRWVVLCWSQACLVAILLYTYAGWDGLYCVGLKLVWWPYYCICMQVEMGCIVLVSSLSGGHITVHVCKLRWVVLCWSQACLVAIQLSLPYVCFRFYREYCYHVNTN